MDVRGVNLRKGVSRVDDSVGEVGRGEGLPRSMGGDD